MRARERERESKEARERTEPSHPGLKYPNLDRLEKDSPLPQPHWYCNPHHGAGGYTWRRLWLCACMRLHLCVCVCVCVCVFAPLFVCVHRGATTQHCFCSRFPLGFFCAFTLNSSETVHTLDYYFTLFVDIHSVLQGQSKKHRGKRNGSIVLKLFYYVVS